MVSKSVLVKGILFDSPYVIAFVSTFNFCLLSLCEFSFYLPSPFWLGPHDKPTLYQFYISGFLLWFGPYPQASLAMKWRWVGVKHFSWCTVKIKLKHSSYRVQKCLNRQILGFLGCGHSVMFIFLPIYFSSYLPHWFNKLPSNLLWGNPGNIDIATVLTWMIIERWMLMLNPEYRQVHGWYMWCTALRSYAGTHDT